VAGFPAAFLPPFRGWKAWKAGKIEIIDFFLAFQLSKAKTLLESWKAGPLGHLWRPKLQAGRAFQAFQAGSAGKPGKLRLTLSRRLAGKLLESSGKLWKA
jgi:hypothetical protein